MKKNKGNFFFFLKHNDNKWKEKRFHTKTRIRNEPKLNRRDEKRKKI